MKKLALVLLLIFSISVSAQEWINIGISKTTINLKRVTLKYTIDKDGKFNRNVEFQGTPMQLVAKYEKEGWKVFEINEYYNPLNGNILNVWLRRDEE